jgi:hypothetical protein
MSHLAAQRALVRMLFDPAFAAEVQRDPERALPSLDPSLRGELATIDARALKLDRLRWSRTLAILREEFPSSCAPLDEKALERFFSSREFHDCVEQGSALPLAFAAFLERMTGGSRTLALETAIARARRAAKSAPQVPPHHFAAAPGVFAAENEAGEPVVTVPLDGGITLVTVDAPTHALVRALERPRRADELAAHSPELLASLVADEIVVRA